MTNLIQKLRTLTNDQLIALSHELRHATVPEDALVREVIKGTEYDTTAVLLAFTAVQASLSIVLADRLETSIEAVKKFNEIVLKS